MRDVTINKGRRRLIQAASSAMLIPSFPALAFAGRGAAACNIGVVLPQSAHLPQLSGDFLSGLRLGLAQTGLPINLVLAEHDGQRPALGTRQLADMAKRDDLLMLTAIADPDGAQALHATLAERERPLLVCDAGANIARRAVDSPFISCQSLGYWQSNHAAGVWAASNLGRRAVQAIGWRESGYDLPYAFSRGFADAGGEVLASHISFQPGQQQAFAGLADIVRKTRPSFVHALYSGSEAIAFAEFYRQAGLATIAPLLGGGFLGSPAAPASTLTAASWSGEAAQCSAFAEGCQRTGLSLSPYTMLGYEAALRIGTALTATGSEGKALAQALVASEVQGPRGRIVEDRLQAAGAMTHWLRLGAGERVVVTLPATANVQPVLATLRGQMQSGWAYPYLAA